jgi:UDP-N-acetylglucosamine--N-acetylmuramyl-(pentapeptide) pyrophosphoryl-undecaprenol N-acetylglucosamine transferase
LAALVLRTPTLVHDQNAILGRANRWLAKKVSGVALAFPSQAPEAAQGVVCGNPVRPAIQAMAQAGYAPPVADQPFRLLVTGGSLGARVFAGLLPAAIATLPEGLRMRLQIVQQCRAEDMESVRAAYEAVNLKAELAPFFSNMAERIAASHLVVARAGASTVTELMVIGRPAILIPYPHAMDDHQTANARVMADAGGAWLLPEAEAKPEKLAELLAEALHSPHRLADMAKQAHQPEQAESAQNIAKLIMKIAEK